jgi:predicted ATP-dependent Lon-type protease
MNSIAQFSSNEVDFAVASVVVAGKTLTEKRVSVVEQASSQALAYLCNTKGKVGKFAREGMAVVGLHRIATQARSGNYKPLADAIAATTGQSLTIANRATYESLCGRFEDALQDLPRNGYAVSKKDNTMKPTAKRIALEQVIALIGSVQSIAATL